MQRKSPIHYISPSAISIMANANGSGNDLAVYVAPGARIKVRSKGIPELDFPDSSFPSWALAGRNRRLGSSSHPYTIYARLPKGDSEGGYLAFVPKVNAGTQQAPVWKDKYAYVDTKGLATGTAGQPAGDYWYVRLGDVSLPSGGLRTVTFDTGILGTDQYNAEIAQQDEALRVELDCSVDGVPGGPTPYVPWEKSLDMKARLEGGTGKTTNLQWTIVRNMTPQDAAAGTSGTTTYVAWPDDTRKGAFKTSGAIALKHERKITDKKVDDFDGAVSASFVVTAWDKPSYGQVQRVYAPDGTTAYTYYINITNQSGVRVTLGNIIVFVLSNPDTDGKYATLDGAQFTGEYCETPALAMTPQTGSSLTIDPGKTGRFTVYTNKLYHRAPLAPSLLARAGRPRNVMVFSGEDPGTAIIANMPATAFTGGGTMNLTITDVAPTAEHVILASRSITVMAETDAKLEIELSANTVTYDPDKKKYAPESVDVFVRSTDQRGDVRRVTVTQFNATWLGLQYAFAGTATETWTTLAVNGSGSDDAKAVVGGTTTTGESLFTSKKDIIVRLVRYTEAAATGQTSRKNTELARATIQNYSSLDGSFVTVSWFSKIFKIRQGATNAEGTEIKPNQQITDTMEFNIEALSGLWTQKYVSALGKAGSGSGGGSAFELNEPLNSINNMKSLPTTVGHTIVWSDSGWGFGKAGGGDELGDVLQNIKDNSAADPADLKSGMFLSYFGNAWVYRYSANKLEIQDSSRTTSEGKPYSRSVTIDSSGNFVIDIASFDFMSEDQADDRYVKIDWFKSLFKVHTGANDAAGTEIEPNKDLPSEGFNIESLVGFWTKKWVSALGANGSGSGGGGVIELTGILGSLYRTTTTIGSTAGALCYNGSGDSWSFVPLNQGIDVTALQNYLDDNKYIKGDANTKWWGQTMSNGIVKGDIKDADDIYMNKGKFVKVNFGNNTNYDILGMSDSDNTLLVGWGIRGTSYNTTIAGGANVNIGHGTNANDTYGKYWTVFRGNGHVTVNTSDDTNADRNIFLSVGGSTKTNRLYLSTNPEIYLEYDGNGTTPGVHLVGAGLWSDSFISALGSNPTQGTGFEANRLVSSLNDSTLEPTGYSGKVLVNNNGTWSWEDYGAGGGLDEDAMWVALGGASDTKKIDNSHLSLKSLTFKAGASDTTGVAYSPTGNAGTAITFAAVADSGISVGRNSNTITIGNTEISGLTEGSYTKVTVDKYGRVIAGEKPTTLEGYGITDAVSGATKWWGQPIQTVNNGKVVKGDMTDVGSITMDGNIKMLKDKSLDIKIGESYYSALGTWSASNLQMLYLGYYTSAQEGPGYATSIYGNTLRLFGSSTTLGMYIDNAGNVGVGKWSPSYRLDVEGTVNATEFRVGDNYITTHDTTNKHLKIVTAKEEIRIGTHNSNNTLHINYGVVGTGETLVTDYKWHAGTPETWASFRMGDTQVTKLYLFKPNSDDTGAVYLTYESSGAGKGVHLVGDGFWADGFVSALGSQSSGGQDYFNADMMWKELGTDSTAKLIPRSHLDLSDYALTDDVTKTLTIKNGNGDIIGTYNGTEPEEITVSGLSGDYLPLTLPSGGKTITIPSVANNLNSVVTFKNAGSDYSLIRFEGKDAGGLGFIGIGKTGDNVHLSYVTADANGGYTEGESQWHSILHTGNFRAGDNVSISWNATEKKYVVSSTITALDWSKITTGKPTTLAGYGIATKWWGQTYKTVNGAEVVEGDMTGVGSITMSGNIYMPYNKALIMKTSEDKSEAVISLSPIDTTKTGHDNDVVLLGYETAKHGIKTRIFGGDIGFYYGTGRRHGMILTSEGKLGIGTTDPQTTLDVYGSEYVKDELKIGNERLFWSKRDVNDVFMCYSWNASANSYRDILIGTFTDAIQWGGLYFNGSSWNWGVGTATPATKLDVNGSIKANRFYLRKPNADDTGAIYLVWDENTTTPGVHLVGAGLWADSYISALGSQGSGGQDYFDEQRLWEELGNYDTKKIYNSHLSLYSLSFTTSAGTIEYNPTTGGQTIDLSSVSGNYLPLTGGTLSKSGRDILYINQEGSDAVGSYITFKVNGTDAGYFGYNTGSGFFIQHVYNGVNKTLKIGTAGSLTFAGNTVLDSANSSVSKSGETLTVKINGVSQSLTNTNTWRGIKDDLTSTSTTDSLSANQGKTLYGYITTLQGHFTNGVANSAAKLTTTRKTLWGNEYWTSGGVPTDIGTSSSNASLNYVLDITMSGNLNMGRDRYIEFYLGDKYVPALGVFGNYTVLELGYETTNQKSYQTNIYGSTIEMYSKVSGTITKGFSLNTSGNVCIGNANPSSTVGDILALSPASSSSYTAILYYRPSGYASWSVAANNSNNFYWYTWGGGASGTMMSLTNTGSLTLGSAKGTYIKIGGATLKWTDNGLECDQHFYSKGAVSALGSNASGGGSQIELTGLLAAMYGKDMPSGNGALYYSGDSWSFQPISSGTSGDYIPLSGSDAITGDLKPQNYNSAQNTGCDLGNDSKRWRQIWGRNFIGETIELLEDKNEINFRTTVTDGFGCKVGYRTFGDEALVFANKNASTSFIFYTGQELTETSNATWNYGTPAMQIKQNCVYINTLISNGVNPSYSLYANGSGYFTGSLTTQGFTANEGSFAKLGIGGKDNDNIFYVNGTSNFVGNMSMLTDFHIKQYAPYTGAIAYQIGTDTSNRSVYAQGIWSGTFVSGGSDIRLKDVVCYPNLTIDDIAKAPIFNFTWKDRRDNTTHLGTSAQYWKEILPSVIYTLPDNYLTMEYQTTALAAAVFTARKVVDHELRIKQLEQENAILRKEIEELKAA